MHDHHHSPASGHDHGPSAPVRAQAAVPGFSLLRLSAGQRLAGAGVIVIALWGAVFWALQ